MRTPCRLPLTLVLCLAAPALAQGRPDPAALAVAQKEALMAFAAMDGVAGTRVDAAPLG